MIKPHLWSKSTGFGISQAYWAFKTGIVFASYKDLISYLENEDI